VKAALALIATSLLATAGIAVAAGGSPASEGQALFKRDCSPCHTIGGGDGVGPDLKGIVTSAGADTVRKFILDPGKMIASGDPRITALVKKFHGVTMPNLGLSAAQVDSIVAYLQQRGQGAGGTTTAPTTTTTPAAAGNAEAGKDLFTGATQLAHGGAACISCHSIAGAGSLGGGRIGPDLTQAAAKYGGAKGLVSVLSSIPFPKMVPVYRDHPLTATEQADLAAFLATTPGSPPPGDETWTIVSLGIGVTAAALVLMLVVWPRRRLVVRKRLAPTPRLRRS
jgi:cytochrome c2